MALVVNPNGTCSINGRFGVLPPIKEYSAYMLYYHDHTGRLVVEGVCGVDGKPVPEGASPEKTLLVKLMPPCSLSDSEAMGTGLVSEASLVAEGDIVALFKPGVDVDLRTAACSAYAINTTSGGAKIPADVLAYGKPDRHGLNASLANDHAFDPGAWTRIMLAWTLGRLEADVWAELRAHYDTAKNNTAIACVESGNQGMELHTLIAQRRIPRGEAVSATYGITYWLLHMARHSPNRPAVAFAALELLHGEGADPSNGYADFGVLHDTVWIHKTGEILVVGPPTESVSRASLLESLGFLFLVLIGEHHHNTAVADTWLRSKIKLIEVNTPAGPKLGPGDMDLAVAYCLTSGLKRAEIERHAGEQE